MTPFVEIRLHGRCVAPPIGDLVAIIELDERGLAVAKGCGRPVLEWIADYALRVPGHPPTILSAADGERYLRALPNDFARMTYWSATFHEPIAALIEALEQGGHHDLAKRVRADRDSAFQSPVEGEPKDALVADMLERGEVALGERVEAGEFASSSDELDEWFDSDGGQTAIRASEAYRANRRRAEREARERGGL